MHRISFTVALLLIATSRLRAQSLREEFGQLFIFGEGQDPLFLGGTGDPNNPESVRIHGNHFVPAAVASNGTVISFLTNSIGSNVAQRAGERHQRRHHLQLRGRRPGPDVRPRRGRSSASGPRRWDGVGCSRR